MSAYRLIGWLQGYAVVCLFAFFSVLAISGNYFHWWNVSETPPNDAALAVVVGDVADALFGVVEEVGEEFRG